MNAATTARSFKDSNQINRLGRLVTVTWQRGLKAAVAGVG